MKRIMENSGEWAGQAQNSGNNDQRTAEKRRKDRTRASGWKKILIHTVKANLYTTDIERETEEEREMRGGGGER